MCDKKGRSTTNGRKWTKIDETNWLKTIKMTKESKSIELLVKWIGSRWNQSKFVFFAFVVKILQDEEKVVAQTFDCLDLRLTKFFDCIQLFTKLCQQTARPVSDRGRRGGGGGRRIRRVLVRAESVRNSRSIQHIVANCIAKADQLLANEAGISQFTVFRRPLARRSLFTFGRYGQYFHTFSF